MGTVIGILKEAYFLFERMAPYLLFGFLFAGVLHIFFRTGMVSRHLGRRSFFSVVKASLFGIPLPLCSCSVIPTAMSLKKEGASKGAVLSFLISTPTTGVDSIFATYSLLGGIFTAYRILAAFLTGVLSGTLANILLKKEDAAVDSSGKCKLCGDEEEHVHGLVIRIREVFRYAFRDLLNDSGGAILLGILIGGVISYFLPESFIETYMGSGMKAMLIMLVAGIPMYVCATASIPIAAALMMKGMDPGAALVFLVAGPATNMVTMAIVGREMGRGALAVYLGSIVSCSLALGALLGRFSAYLYDTSGITLMPAHHLESYPGWTAHVSSIVLLLIITANFAVDIAGPGGKTEKKPNKKGGDA